MSTRSVLVSYAGYPYTFSSLMPDNGLANLAGALLCAGQETLVLDYGTVENVEAMLPEELRVLARSAFSSAMERVSSGQPVAPETLSALSSMEESIREASEKRCGQVAEEVCACVEKLKADFVGLKLWNGDGFSGSVEIAREVKRRYKNVMVFAGGPHVDIFRDIIYRVTDVFDALVYGEGEETVVQLTEFVQGRRKLDEVDNVIFEQDGRVTTTPCRRVENLDMLPFPCYDDCVYPAMRGNSKLKVIVLDESRGCPFGCYFCIHPIKSGSRLRTKSAERIAEEMDRIMKSVRTRAFRYAGSATPPALAKEIASLLLGRGMKVIYSAFGNPANASLDCFEELSRSGCQSIFFGIESGSERILRGSMGKNLKPRRISEVIEESKRAGIFTVGSVIFPAPFESEESERATMELLCGVRPDSVVVQFPLVYPGTGWAVNADKFGICFDEREYTEKALTYKAKPLMPLEFWEDLPISMNGRDSATIRKEAARFTKKLEGNGILTSVSDDLVLTARLAGYDGREREFRDVTRALFFCGDAERIGEFVARINRAAAEVNLQPDAGAGRKPV